MVDLTDSSNSSSHLVAGDGDKLGPTPGPEGEHNVFGLPRSGSPAATVPGLAVTNRRGLLSGVKPEALVALTVSPYGSNHEVLT